MEHKIGEIFEYNGEWYQCLKSTSCDECVFLNNCINNPRLKCSADDRTDNCTVIFKKLEKVGEPLKINGKIYQGLISPYGFNNCSRCAFRTISCKDVISCYDDYIFIEIKQTKEDMEENKTPLPKEDNALTRTVYAYVSGKISDKELIRSIKEMSDEYPYNKNNLKPFDLEAAKAGKPVCTRDGRKARIICFDTINEVNYPIIALIEGCGYETLCYYNEGGKAHLGNTFDLMMLPEKKERWVNIYDDMIIYESEEEAKIGIATARNYIATTKVEWEE